MVENSQNIERRESQWNWEGRGGDCERDSMWGTPGGDAKSVLTHGAKWVEQRGVVRVEGMR